MIWGWHIVGLPTVPTEIHFFTRTMQLAIQFWLLKLISNYCCLNLNHHASIQNSSITMEASCSDILWTKSNITFFKHFLKLRYFFQLLLTVFVLLELVISGINFLSHVHLKPQNFLHLLLHNKQAGDLCVYVREEIIRNTAIDIIKQEGRKGLRAGYICCIL